MTFSVFLKKVKHKADVYLGRARRWRKDKEIMAAMISEKGKDEVVFITKSAIGDTVYGLSSLDAYRQKHPNNKIIVLGDEKYAELINSYANIDKTVFYCADSEVYRKLATLYGFPKLCAKGAQNGVYMTLPITKGKRNVDAIRQQRLTVFHLDENAPITYHGLTKGKVNAIKDFDAIKDKVVIINPYSTTMRFVTMSLYEKLCDILISRGYRVYTNVIGDQKPVGDSEPLRCSIAELYSIACDIPLIVSVRSGILDLLAKSNINMFVLYENAVGSWGCEFYRLDAWRCQGMIEEIHIDNKNMEHVPDRFSAYLDRLGS